MEKHFKVGDFVRRILSGEIVKIEVIKEDWIAFREARLTTGACPMEEVEPVDPKTAFLSELKGLLEKYGAELGDSGMYEIEGMEVTFDNGDRIRYKHCTINALNIMDYEKD